MILIESIFDNSIIAIESTNTYIVIESSFLGGGGGGGTWGSITGTLSNQTDLQNALDAKVPYSGATGNVTLGEYGITTGYTQFDTTPTQASGIGRLIWNDTDGTLDLGLKGGNVTLQVGQDQIVRVVNKTGSTLNASDYKVVRVSTAQGQRLGVALAQADGDPNSADTLGVVIENISNNQEGFIACSGIVHNINTTGSIQGETWADGDVLYLSGTTAGGITNIKPTAPIHLVRIGYVVYAHNNQGKIYVSVLNGYELEELHDVKITTPTNGQVLKYNSTSGLWENAADAGGITTLNTLTALVQTFATGTSGTDFNISSSTSTHTFNIPTASATNRGALSSADWTTFNNKQNALTFGNLTESTSSVLTITGGTGSVIGSGTTIQVKQASGSVSGFLSSTDFNTFNSKEPAITAGTTSQYYRGDKTFQTLNTAAVTESTNLYYTDARARSAISLTTTGTSGAATYISGVLNIPQYQAALTNPVTGTGTSGQIAYWSGTTTQTGSATFTFTPTSEHLINNSVTASGAIARGTNITSTLTAAANNDVLVGLDISTTGTLGAFTGIQQNAIRTRSTFAPTSGDATMTSILISPTINQTGGANGVTRGVYVNPTLTAASSYRAIEWSNTSGWGLYGAGSANNYLAGKLLIATTTDAGYNLDVNGAGRFTGNLRIDANIRDNRDNNLLVQSASTVASNRDLTIGNGTYSRAMFISRQYSFTSGTHPTLGQYSFYHNGETNSTSLNVYFKATTPTNTNLNGGDFIIELPSGTGTGRSGRVAIGNTSPSFTLDLTGTFRVTSTSQFDDNVTITDAKNLILGTTTGTKIGTATSQKLSFWNATPIVQPTTGVAAATFTANTGTTVNDASTFDGYTIAQVVKALRNAGLLA